MNFDFIPGIMREASKLMLKAHDIDSHMNAKPGDQNFVTEYDVATHNYLMEAIAKELPEAVFIGEEKDNDPAVLNSGAPCFIIDPIDGTTNFIHDFRISVISVGVCVGGTIVYGAIFDPYSDTMYIGERGKGAHMTMAGVTRPIHVRGGGLSENMVMFGASPYKRDLFADKTFRTLRKIFDRARELRCLGSAAAHMMYVSCGRAGAFIEYQLSPWDYAAASVIIEEAGGIITQMNGEPVTFDKPCSIVAAAPAVYQDLMNGDIFEI